MTVRFLIQDTDPEQPLLSDEEIGWMITTWKSKGSSLYFVAAKCCQNIAMKFAREVSYSSDAESLSLSELMNKYQAMSESLIANDNTMGVGVLFVGGEGGADTRGPLFAVGMHDDPEAGPQVIMAPPPVGTEQW